MFRIAETGSLTPRQPAGEFADMVGHATADLSDDEREMAAGVLRRITRAVRTRQVASVMVGPG